MFTDFLQSARSCNRIRFPIFTNLLPLVFSESLFPAKIKDYIHSIVLKAY